MKKVLNFSIGFAVVMAGIGAILLMGGNTAGVYLLIPGGIYALAKS